MARIRTIKPEFFFHDELFELESETGLPVRLAFIALWTQCDREGRFKWRPKVLKAACLPFDDVDFSRVLHALTTRDFIRHYTVEGEEFGIIPTFLKHQVINHRESESNIPSPELADTSTRAPRVPDACPTREGHARGERKGKEGKGKEGVYVDDAHASPHVAVATPPEIKHLSNSDQDFMQHWNEHVPFAQIRTMNSNRRHQFRTRMKDAFFRDNWREAVERIRGSPFLSGESGGWKADVDWFLKPNSCAKVIEGKYGNVSSELPF